MTRESKTRPWRQIAEELERERDPQKILDLAAELNVALDAQGATARPAERKAPQPPASG